MKKFFLLFCLFPVLLLSKGSLAIHTNHSNSRHVVHSHRHKGPMHGRFGSYPMSREASGTSWQPDSTPHHGVNWHGRDYMLMLHGLVHLSYTEQGGARGKDELFSTNMLAFMGYKDINKTTLGFRAMASLEPITTGKNGYPLIFQTGETADGRTPLINRQHPHDLFMELSGSIKYDAQDKGSLYLYLGLPGEPAIGPAVFMHRYSGEDIPEAPLSHHWLDSTHITYGVVTLGYVYKLAKLEVSIFNGDEPDENRYDLELPTIDSWSWRFSANPYKNLSLQFSYAFLAEPEQIKPNTSIRRTTLSFIYNYPFGNEHNWQTTFAWGRNRERPGQITDAFLVESTLNLRDRYIFLGRFEVVEKESRDFLSENLFPKSEFTINKISLGYIYNLAHIGEGKLGLGVMGSLHVLPPTFERFYTKLPMSVTFFARAKF